RDRSRRGERSLQRRLARPVRRGRRRLRPRRRCARRRIGGHLAPETRRRARQRKHQIQLHRWRTRGLCRRWRHIVHGNGGRRKRRSPRRAVRPGRRSSRLGAADAAPAGPQPRRHHGRPCRAFRRQPWRRFLHQPFRKRPLMNIFKRPATHYGKSPEPETPYQKAAQVWDERIGSARMQARNWRLMAFGSLILSAGFASALVWQSARGTVVPWVVQVDNLGQAQTVAPAVADYRPTDPQIAWHLGRFIEQVRSIPADPIIVRQNWLRAYEWTTDRGAAALNDYARANDPFARVGRQQIAVEVSSVIRASPDSFRV